MLMWITKMPRFFYLIFCRSFVQTEMMLANAFMAKKVSRSHSYFQFNFLYCFPWYVGMLAFSALLQINQASKIMLL
jgi:hypothetical protein